jgi:hypothetical protein
MYDPFFEDTYNHEREGDLDGNGEINADDWGPYWDETNVSSTPSQPAADATYAEDAALAQTINLFNLGDFFTNNLPPDNYVESGAGQYFVSSGSQKRASFADAAARHKMLYSRYHKSKYFCSTCHDVSNPALANLGLSGLLDQTGGTHLITEQYSAYAYFHVERTFSEFMLSAYGQEGGAVTNAEFQEQGAPDIQWASKCQDCHMRDVVGVGCNKKGVPLRPDESVEHPASGQPLHDMTGGNAWVSWVLASAIPGSPNEDITNIPSNAELLNGHYGPLTLDLTQGEGIDPVALLAGVDRAKQQLLLAATVKDVNYTPTTGALSFQVQNNTPHKLISGFPEGRRMFVNIKVYMNDGKMYQVNPYDADAGTLKGLDYPYQPDPNGVLDPPQDLNADNEAYEDELVYEMKPSSTLTGEKKTFHFALADGRYKDNRIPPKGFGVDINGNDASKRLCVPVMGGVENSDYFTPDEYAGGYDRVDLDLNSIFFDLIPDSVSGIEVNLYYQTTSREYIEFLRDEINGAEENLTLSSPTPSGEAKAYIAQTDSFFAQLRAWGDTIWNLWTHNMDVEGAAPFLMTSASYGSPPSAPCELSAPSRLEANPGHTQVTLNWTGVSGAAGYNVYYDQAGKAQLVADAENNTTYIDTGLTNGIEYCYKVTAYDDACESLFSEILCAVPENQGQTTPPVGVDLIKTGLLSGKGKNKQFVETSSFSPGDAIVVRAHVVDGVTPVSNATVEITIGGPETVTLNSGPSTADGWAEATWNTQAPNKRGQGGTTPGSYTATTTNVTATGFHWDSVTTSTSFTLSPPP